MKKRLAWHGKLFLVLGIAGALSFGAKTAFAKSHALSDCMYNPPEYLGACTDNANCAAMCMAVLGSDYTTSICAHGCCICAV